VTGSTLESVSAATGLTMAALNRHKKNHIPVTLAKAQEAQEISAADNLIDSVKGLRDRTDAILRKAETANNLNTALQAIRELRGIFELQAKFTGAINTQTINNIVIMPEWAALRFAIMDALEPYPDAAGAVSEAIRGIED